jgi:uncharacterized protein (DUF952 family)
LSKIAIVQILLVAMHTSTGFIKRSRAARISTKANNVFVGDNDCEIAINGSCVDLKDIDRQN